MPDARAEIVGVLIRRDVDTGKTALACATDIVHATALLHRAGFALVLLPEDDEVTIRHRRRRFRWWPY